MPASGERRDPLPVYCFRVEIDNIPGTTAFFKSVSGLKYETEVVDFQEGGQNQFSHRLVGPTKWANLIFKRGFAQDDKLIKWCQDWIEGNKTRRNGKVIQLNTKLEPVCSWSFRGWPCKWELSELDASKSELGIETLEIAHHGLKFKLGE
jgi:phage tail-like protein